MPGEIGKVRRFLSSRPVFTRGQFREIVGAGAVGEHGRHAARSSCEGAAHRARGSGVYAAVPPHLSQRRSRRTLSLVASMIRDDGILAYHTALGLHGLAYSEGGETFVLSCGKPWQVDTISGPVRFVTQPAALVGRRWSSTESRRWIGAVSTSA